MKLSEWILIFGMFLVTFGVRYPVLAFVSRLQLPKTIHNALRFIPAAVLSAIIVPALLFPDGKNLYLSLENDYLAAGAISVLIAWRAKNLLVTIIAGMAIFLGLRFILN